MRIKNLFKINIDAERHPKLYKAYKWIENQWYHNKPGILCTAFFGFVIIFGLSQCISKIEPDYKILLCANKYLSSDVRSAVEIYFEQYAEDINGDGEITVHIMDCTKGSDNDQYAANMTTLLSELQMGDSILIIADEYYYNYLTQNGNIFDTDECFDEKNSMALKLHGTEFDKFIDLTLDGFVTEDMMLYKRLTDGTDSGNSKKAIAAKENSENLLKKFKESLGTK